MDTLGTHDLKNIQNSIKHNQSVDQNEIKKFDNLSSQWWDKEGQFKILHQINPIRKEYIIRKIKEHFSISDLQSINEPIALIDVGCGGGIFSESIADINNINITALDACFSNIEIAKKNSKYNHINYICDTVENLAVQNKKYDVVICLEMIEHVADVEYFVNHLVKLVNKGGMIVISTLNRNIKSYLLAIMIAENLLKWVPKDTHDYRKFIKPSELYKLLSFNDFIIQELKGLSYDLHACTWKLTDDVSINYFAYIKSNN